MKKIKIFIYVIILVKICIAQECEAVDHLSNCEDYPSVGTGNDFKKCFLDDNENKCKLRSCSDFEQDRCQDFGSDNSGLQCITKMSWAPDKHNIIREGCALQQCTDLPVGYCSWWNSDDELFCMENEDSTGCVLTSCSNLKPGKCNRMYFPDGEKQCKETEDGKGCEIKKCSDYSSDECSKFTPEDNRFKCLPEGSGCLQKKCSNLSSANCGDINPMRNNLYECVAVEGSCKETYRRCEDLPYQYCSLYMESLYYGEEPGKCIKNEKSKKCELKSCETTPSNQCSSFISDNPNEICTDSEENKCQVKKCSTLAKTECSSFIPNDKGYKCVEDGDNCKIVEKDCGEEFSADECQFFHSSDPTQTCLPNGTGGCSLLSCEGLSPDSCSQFRSQDPNKQCILTGGSCHLVECGDLSNDECDKFLTSDLPFTCQNEGGSNCQDYTKYCNDIPIKYCSEIIYSIGCVLNDKGNKCVSIYDDSNLKDDSEGSEDGENKKSSAVLFSISSIYILLLLF